LSVAALQQQIEQLREAVQARDEFISIAAHELRNPLTPLLMTVQSMRRNAERNSELPAQIVTGLVRLDRVVQHYVNRCNSMLDISRLSSGTFRIDWAEVDFAALLRDTLEALAPQAERAGSAISLTAPVSLAGTWDELAVQQIAENLLSNAIKYGAGRPIEVTLTEEHGSVALEIRDQGIGISAADQARIFSRFERAVSRQQRPGFGLGLWVVGRLVAAMHGTVQVSSDVGRGSSFRVRLPRGRTTTPG